LTAARGAGYSARMHQVILAALLSLALLALGGLLLRPARTN
jgi:hypothetical protein